MTRILSVDIGTTSIKAAIIEGDSLDIIETSTTTSPIRYPRPGWAEQDLEILWNTIAELARTMKHSASSDALVFSTHMAGVALLDREGRPMTPLLTWLDERAAGLPRKLFKGPLRISGYNPWRLIRFLRLTGGAPSKTGKDALSKMEWLRIFEGDKWASARYIADLKSYLLLRTVGRHATSPDEAHLKWLADTRKGKALWHRGLLEEYGIPEDKLPEILDSPSIAGYLREDAARELGLRVGIPVVVGAGDVASVAVGSGAIGDREYHVYVGTSDWVAVHSDKRVLDVKHYVGSLLSAIPSRYLVIGEQENAGLVLDWVLRITRSTYKSIDEAVAIGPGDHGIRATPWMMGERTPIDDPEAKMALIGLQPWHAPAHIIRAVLDSLAANIRLAFHAVAGLVGVPSRVVAVGGVMKSRAWRRLLASSLNTPIEVARDPQQAGLRGSAIIALAALGEGDFKDLAQRIPMEETVEPDESLAEFYENMAVELLRIHKALKRL